MRALSTTETLPRQDQPSGDEPVLCWSCGKPYRGNLAVDRRVHKDHHRRALTARVSLAGVGPLPFPATRAEWKDLEDPQSRSASDPVEAALRDWWWDFARSLATVSYNLKRHCSWHDYVRMRLADEVEWLWWGRDVMRALKAEFGTPIYYMRPISDLRRAGRRRTRR
jgi:hypothetical protein